MKDYHFTAYIEKDTKIGLHSGYAPHLQGVHTQGETLDELPSNLQEVISLCTEDFQKKKKKH